MCNMMFLLGVNAGDMKSLWIAGFIPAKLSWA